MYAFTQLKYLATNDTYKGWNFWFWSLFTLASLHIWLHHKWTWVGLFARYNNIIFGQIIFSHQFSLTITLVHFLWFSVSLTSWIINNLVPYRSWWYVCVRKVYFITKYLMKNRTKFYLHLPKIEIRNSFSQQTSDKPEVFFQLNFIPW